MTRHERRWERTRTRVQARVKEIGAGSAVTGFTRDISHDGLFIQTRNPFPPGTRVEIELLYKPTPIELEGIVVRSARAPHHLLTVQASGMGVKILRSNRSAEALAPPVADAEAAQEASAKPADDARNIRVTVGTEVAVFFGNEKHMLALYDLSASGAAFVSASELPEAASVIVHLPLSDGTEVVEVEAVPVRSRRLGDATVLSVRFVHVPDEVVSKIQAFVSAKGTGAATGEHE